MIAAVEELAAHARAVAHVLALESADLLSLDNDRWGLLAESHVWKADHSDPLKNIESAITECENNLLNTPREGLDLICIADLASWRRVLFVMPMRWQDPHPDMPAGLRLGSLVGSGMFNSDTNPTEPSPHGKIGMRNWKLADVVSDDVMDHLEAGPLSGRDWELGYT